jgi:hypothetical protein
VGCCTLPGARLGQGRRRALEADSRQPVHAHHLDQRPDLGLGAAEQDRAATYAQASGQDRQIEHQRPVREHKLAEVDDDIALCAYRAGQSLPSASLRGLILVSAAAQSRGLFIEIDDMPKPTENQRCPTRGQRSSLVHFADHGYR